MVISNHEKSVRAIDFDSNLFDFDINGRVGAGCLMTQQHHPVLKTSF